MNTTFDLLHSVFGLNPNLSLTEGSANVQPSRLSQSVLNNKSELSFELTEIPDSIWEKVRLSVPDSYLRSFDSLRALFKLLLTEPSFSGSFSGLDGQLEVTSLEIHSLLTEVEPLPLDSEPPVIPLLSGLDSIDFIMNRDLTSSYEITSSCKL